MHKRVESMGEYLGQHELDAELSLGDFGCCHAVIIGHAYHSKTSGFMCRITEINILANNRTYNWLHKINLEKLEMIESYFLSMVISSYDLSSGGVYEGDIDGTKDV